MGKIFEGFTAKIFIGGTEIDGCSNVSVEIKDNVEDYYGVESTSPVIISEGTQEITGHIKRAWVNIYYLGLLGIKSTPFSWNNNVQFDLLLMSSKGMNDPGAPMLYLYNCRFSKATISIPATGFLEEEYDFVSTSSGEGEWSGSPPPQPTPILGSYFWNNSKPYFWNGWYYVFFQRTNGNYKDIYYARSNGIIWINPVLIVHEYSTYNFHWGSMCIDNKVLVGWGNEVTYGYSEAYCQIGTIQPDGTIAMEPKVQVTTSSYSLAATVRASKVSGSRKYFFIHSGLDGYSSADFLWISDNDGTSWTYKGYVETFSDYYWFNQRAIPFEDGNKFVEIHAPGSGSPENDHYHFWSQYRDPNGSNGPETYIGTFEELWYVYDKAEGTYKRDSNQIFVSWIDTSLQIQLAYSNKENPSVWNSVGVVDSLNVKPGNPFSPGNYGDLVIGCSPAYDNHYQSIYIFYYGWDPSDSLYKIWYKRWTGNFEDRNVFYSSTLPIGRLCIYPESISNRIVVAWNENDNENWSGNTYVKCSALITGPPPPPESNRTLDIYSNLEILWGYFLPEETLSILSSIELETAPGVVSFLPIAFTYDSILDFSTINAPISFTNSVSLDFSTSSTSISFTNDTSLSSSSVLMILNASNEIRSDEALPDESTSISSSFSIRSDDPLPSDTLTISLTFETEVT